LKQLEDTCLQFRLNVSKVFSALGWSFLSGSYVLMGNTILVATTYSKAVGKWFSWFSPETSRSFA